MNILLYPRRGYMWFASASVGATLVVARARSAATGALWVRKPVALPLASDDHQGRPYGYSLPECTMPQTDAPG
ncbi:MAG TPA: hypothetical protein VFQ30_07500 [Ktedonobacteraceae bacterium]|nr:hypothetical protein [Ktedonobacteraceae bacterium]